MSLKFEHGGNEYVEIDFDNQFTAEQDDIFSGIKIMVNRATEYVRSHAKDLSDESKVLSLIDEGFADFKGRTIAELLAHTYLNKGEDVFNPDTFEERVQMFLKMPLAKRRPLEKAIPKLLVGVMRSGVEGIVNYLPIPQPQTQP